MGFSVIIDMRGSTWQSVKPTLKLLQVNMQDITGIYSNITGIYSNATGKY